MRFRTLSEWLTWIKTLHPVEMDLSLERVTEIAKRLHLLNPAYTVVTVAGTNGKGSCVAGLEAIYLAAGYQVGAFTSPYLFQYNEQVRIQGIAVDDDDFCQAFEKVADACQEITLTPFEFTALAAFVIFQQANLDIVILEVGLGGRWDAVNVMDADVALVTSIAIDHAAILGNTREEIGREKSGIFRKNKPVVCGDFDPPLSIINHAADLSSPIFCQGREFKFIDEKNSWTWQSEKNKFENLPLSFLALQNMSTVLMAVELLQEKFPITRNTIDRALSTVNLPGRIQIIPGDVTQIFDVSHNPAAAEFLVNKLRHQSCNGKTRAVFSMLADKDIVSTISIMDELIDEWFVAPLAVPRGASHSVLTESFQKAAIKNVASHAMIAEAYQAAMNKSVIGDRVIVFGSFHTVSGVLKN